MHIFRGFIIKHSSIYWKHSQNFSPYKPFKANSLQSPFFLITTRSFSSFLESGTSNYIHISVFNFLLVICKYIYIRVPSAYFWVGNVLVKANFSTSPSLRLKNHPIILVLTVIMHFQFKTILESLSQLKNSSKTTFRYFSVLCTPEWWGGSIFLQC